jgi:hypothetical protein
MEALGPEMGPKGGKEKRKRKKENKIIKNDCYKVLV